MKSQELVWEQKNVNLGHHHMRIVNNIKICYYFDKPVCKIDIKRKKFAVDMSYKDKNILKCCKDTLTN